MGGKAKAVGRGEFPFAAAFLEHGHIYGQCQGLIDEGAELKWVYDPDPQKVEAFRRKFPQAQAARCYDEILSDASVRLVAAAAVPCERCARGVEAMDAGKDYFTDKAALTTLGQLDEAKAAVRRTGRKYAVYYGERLHSECSVLAGQMIKSGAIGRVVQVLGLGPHRLGAISSRPEWFFDREKTGGILIDIGSHQIEQFLFYAGEEDATIAMARTANRFHQDYPGIDDYGDVALTGAKGAMGYLRVDWLTPDGLSSWGDGRLILLGEKGFIELRKNLNLAVGDGGNQLFIADALGERRIHADGATGYPYFHDLILDCLNRTENAMTQEHAFKAAELAVRAQALAEERK